MSARPLCAFALPSTALAQTFETVSVKAAADCETISAPRLGITVSPGTLRVQCQTVEFLIRQSLLAGGRDPLLVSPKTYNQTLKSPPWAAIERYTVDAKSPTPQSRAIMLGPMLQTVLENRFHLRFHRETREVSVYELTALPSGPKLDKARDHSCVPFDPDVPEPPRGSHLCGVLIRSVNPAVPSARPAPP